MPACHAAGNPPRAARCGAGPALLIALAGVPGLRAQAPASRPAEPTFQAAEDHALRGRYAQAIKTLDALARVPDQAVRAACDRSAIDLQTGAYAEGLTRLRKIRDRAARSPDWHVCLAALLEATGDYENALAHNRRAVALDEEHIRGHWQLGRVLERLGRLDGALEAYSVLEEILTRETLPEDADAEEITLLGRGLHRYSILTGTNVVRRTQLVLDLLTVDVLHETDPRYWPAALAAADLLSRYDPEAARDDYQSILEQNPRAADGHVALGRAYLAERRTEEAERRARVALGVNPNHVEALRLLAEVRMTECRAAEAARLAERALAVNPNSIAVLGVLAAARQRMGDNRAVAELLRRAKAVTPRPAAFHEALGRWLAAARRYAEAEDHLKKAIAFAPREAAPRRALGRLYMEIGEEGPARKALEAAFELDSFNQRTFDVLELLDRLDRFARLETEHFILKYDEAEDGVAAPYFSQALEDQYAEVSRRFGVRLKKKTIVELFPHHDGFSTRVDGRPFVATIGACSGRVIALTAPRGRPPFGWYNWRSVLRHELTHAVTLAASDHRVPRWLTEGLAVREEPAPRSWAWKRILSEAVRRGRLYRLDAIDQGFVRPKQPDGVELAYAQSEWMVDFLVDRAGEGAVGQSLGAFREGLDPAAAFRRVMKLDARRFDAEFADWARRHVEQWGLPVLSVEDPETIRSELKQRPQDAGLLARLARAEWLDGRWEAAESAAAEALRIDGKQTTALEIMGRVWIGRMLREELPAERRALIERAEPYLRRLWDLEPDNATAIQFLGYVEQAGAQWNEAIALYRRYQRRFPEDPDTYRRLAAIYLRRKNEAAALEQLEALGRLVDNDAPVARRIAAIHAARGKPAEAARWWRRALDIDPYDVETHGALADACLALGEYRQAEREYAVVCRMLPEEALGYEGLSRVHAALGNREQAAEYEKKAAALRGGKESSEGAKHRKFD